MYTSRFSSETIKKSWMIMSSQDVLFVSFDQSVHVGIGWIVFQLERELGFSIVRIDGIVRTDAFGAYVWKSEHCACKRIRLLNCKLVLFNC